MTDERIADLEYAVSALPKGSGIVFRHHATAVHERYLLFARLLRMARQRRCIVLLADTPLRAWQWGADGAHHRTARQSRGIRSVAVHNSRECAVAKRIKADLMFVSPIFPTRSHPGNWGIGVVQTGLIAGNARSKTIALGGLSRSRWKRVAALGLYGWAAIDGLTDQKRMAVPT